MHPSQFRFRCPACAGLLRLIEQGLQENLDGGPPLWTGTLRCDPCNRSFRSAWILRLVPSATGVDCKPEQRRFRDDDSPIVEAKESD